MPYETIVVEPGTVTKIGLNRPERRNAINRQMERELAAALTAADADPDCHVIILHGHGPVFSAGHDLYEVAAMYAGGENVGDLYFGKRTLQEDVWNVRTPIIAAVHGYLGPHAIHTVMCADLIIAAEGTRFSMEQVRVGGANGNPQVTFTIGEKRHKEWRLLGKAIDARVALRWGIVNAVVPAEQLMATATRWAEWIAAVPPQNAVANKLSVNKDVERLGIWELHKLGFFFGRMGHGSTVDRAFFQRVLDEGLKPSLRERDAKFQGQQQV
jgi:enoyl-CoA hydratase/carnithine racemase